MDDQTSFKARVTGEIIRGAAVFKDCFVDYEYLLCSDAFIHRPYYIVRANGDNYQHLTGVASRIKAGDFFERCLAGTLTEEDISFIKAGQSEKEVKGSVRRKIAVLPCLSAMFGEDVLVEEDFAKNRIRCSFALGKEACTLGFSNAGTARPQSLLKGDLLDRSKARPLSLVLRRPSGAVQFDRLLLGRAEELRERLAAIKEELADELLP